MSAAMFVASSFVYGKLPLGSEIGFLGAMLWVFSGFYLLRRYNLQKKRTIGIITPFSLLGAVISSGIVFFYYGPVLWR